MKMTIARLTGLWTSAVVLVIMWWSPIVIGSDVGRSGKCSVDVRAETRRCLADYTDRLDDPLQSDNRFFPGLDVEVIRSLCSLLEDSRRCINAIVETCPAERQAIEDELSPHVGVKQLCVHTNIYEDYALNQNCFVRIRPDAETCNHKIMMSVQDDEPFGRQPSSSSSSLSSSQRHQTSQQRHYCDNVNRLIVCIKSLIRNNTVTSGPCQKMAQKLVGVLVRASVPTTCHDEPSPTSAPAQGKTSERLVVGGRSSGTALHGSDGPLTFCCYVLLAGVVCLQSFLLHLLETAALLLFHRRPSPTAPLPPQPPPPPPPQPHRRHLRHHRFLALLLS